MGTRRYAAARSGSDWTVTRSTTDGLDGQASFLWDDSTVTSKLQVKELWQDILHELSRDWGAASQPSHADQGADTYTASLAANNASTIIRDASLSIGSADAALLLDITAGKLELRNAINAIGRALQRDALSASAPGSYPTEGSLVV